MHKFQPVLANAEIWLTKLPQGNDKFCNLFDILTVNFNLFCLDRLK